MTTSLAELCATLLADVRSDAPGAWGRLLQEFGPLVYKAGHDAGLQGDDLDDVYQATWLALHRSIPRIQAPGALAAWIATTARREAWKASRRASRHTSEAEVEEQPEELDRRDPAEALQRFEDWRWVQQGLDALNERCRKLLERLFLAAEEPSYESIAADLGMARGSIGPTRHRCLAKLASWLADRGIS